MTSLRSNAAVILRNAALVATTILICGYPASLEAQLPSTRLGDIFPAGANPGSSVEVTVAGTDLDDAGQIHFSHPGITAERKMAEPGPFDEGPQPVENTFVVSIASDVPVGCYDVRVEGKYGVSNPRVFEVGHLPEMLESEPNEKAGDGAELTLPITINGRMDRTADVDLFPFRARRGQRILIDGRGRRIDSQVDLVVSVSDATGREVAFSREGHAGDPLIDFVAEQDGVYVAKVFDSLYRGGPGYAYRLVIGQLPHIDCIFPPAGVPGQRNSFTIYGRNLPGGKPTEMIVNGARLEEQTVAIDIPGDLPAVATFDMRIDARQAFVDGIEYRIESGESRSNPMLIGLATAELTKEVEPNDQPGAAQLVAVPCEIAGRFAPQRDQDWYAFEAKKEDTFAIELMFNRLGFAGDPIIVVQQVTKKDDGEEQSRVLATADDSGHRDGGRAFDTRCGDPIYRFTAPADGVYRIQVQDGYSSLRDDPRQVYRLAIRTEKPDFRLAAVPSDTSGGLLLRRGGSTAIVVVAERRDGYDGEISVSATDLPSGVTSQDVVIGPTVSATTLVLTATENAAPSTTPIRIVGRATVGDQDVERTAKPAATTAPLALRRPNQVLNSVPARLTRELTLTVSGDEPAVVAFQTEAGKVWETSRAGILTIPFKVTRRGDYKGTISTEVRHLPANVNRVNFSIAGNKNDGEMKIPLRTNTPEGTYTLHVAGFVQNMPYRRNPKAAEAAAEQKKKFDKIATETAAAAKAAATAKTQAENAAKQAAQKLAEADRVRQQAEKTASDKRAAQAAAKQALAKAEDAAKENAEDAALATARDAAQKKLATADAELKTADESLSKANKQVEEAKRQDELAEEQRELAVAKANETAELAKAATDAKRIADKRATDTANAARQRNVNFWIHSNPVTIKITSSPVSIKPLPDESKLNQGESIEIPLSLDRKYEFQEQIRFTADIPRGVSGLSFKTADVPKGQQQCKLSVTAAANATPGVHQLNLKATMRVNNQNLVTEQPLVVRVVEVPKEQ